MEALGIGFACCCCWMHGCIGACMHGQIDGWETCLSTNNWDMNEHASEWMSEQTSKWMNVSQCAGIWRTVQLVAVRWRWHPLLYWLCQWAAARLWPQPALRHHRYGSAKNPKLRNCIMPFTLLMVTRYDSSSASFLCFACIARKRHKEYCPPKFV